MNCPNCSKEIIADKVFCNWCEAFIPKPSVGKKSGLFRRWVANFIDPIIVTIMFFILLVIFINIFGSSSAPVIAMAIALIGYGIFFFWFLSKGMTLGKWLMGEMVVEKLSGNYPGFWRMILREVIGKFVSGMLLGLGFLWAIWDKDNQAWHDKIAGTVVVRKK